MIPVLLFLNILAIHPAYPATSTSNENNPLEDKNFTLHTVKAQSGDGVYSILRRYYLKSHQCNVNKFYALNNLTSKDILYSGVEYKVPIYVLEYNGKSIRSTIGINNWEKAVKIKEYNEKLLTENIRQGNYTENKILWVPHHALFCEKEPDIETISEEIAHKSTFLDVKLFGEKYTKVERVDQRLKDHVYYLVSGHGGPDPGARCTDCPTILCEDEYAYDVVLRLGRNLMQHGAKVEFIVQDRSDGIRDDQILHCDSDEIYLGNHVIERNQYNRLKKRASIINELYVSNKKKGYKKQRAIMIHVDSQNSNNRQDVYFYYLKTSREGRQLALDLKDTFRMKYEIHQKDRGYKGFVRERSLFMLRETYPAAVYIELANIRNSADHKRLLLDTNRQALANWIFESLIKS